MHTTYSDGVLAPSVVLERAFKAGLRHVAITDHDALGGSLEAAALSAERDIELIPGVEITTQTDLRTVHLLGYFVNVNNGPLRQLFEYSKQQRENRTCAIADNLAEDGFKVSGDVLRASGQPVNRPLLGRMLVENGEAESLNDAFKRFMSPVSKYYVDYVSVETEEAIQLIAGAGGHAFVAHPSLYKVVDLIPAFKKEGLRGIEAFHTLQSSEESSMLVTLAEDLNLAVSGGSDWHGDTTYGAFPGSAGLNEIRFAAFMRACDR